MATELTTMDSKPNGFKTMIDTVIAPKDAFEAVRARPTWLVAAASLVICYLAAYFLMRDATLHASLESIKHMIAPGGMLAGQTDLQKQVMLQNAEHPPASQLYLGIIGGIFGLFVGVALNSLFLLIGNAIGKGDRGFGTLWAASMNNAFATQGIAYIVLGIILRLRGPESFNGNLDIYDAMPGLGMLHMHGYLGGFLSFITIFSVWGLVLNAFTLQIATRTKGPITWIVPAVIMLLGASFFGIFGLFG